MDARNAYEQAKQEVEEFIEAEKAAAAKYKVSKDKKDEAVARTQAERVKFMEASKQLTMMEVMASALKSKKIAEDAKRELAERKMEAKRALAEQKQREREAIEATRRALQETKSKRKELDRTLPLEAAAEAAAEEPAAKRLATSPDEQDTIPATIADTQTDNIE